MQEGGTAKLVARWAALGALFLVTLTPLFVDNALFFPFITGKAFFFRTGVEAAVVAWTILAFLDREYRPRFSWIGAAAVAFVLWMFVADLFAVNVFKAFWSNFERMEGWMLLIHLLGFFFAASSVLRVEKKWRTWFLASLAVSVLVSLYALLQLAGVFAIHQGSTRIDATFGNSAYLAIYLLFNVFVAGWLAFTENRAWLRYSLLALAALEGILILFTETRGTILGLTGGLLLTGILVAITGSARSRRVALAAVAAIIVLAGGLYAVRNSSAVQNSPVLGRIASISLSDGTTRFTIWHMAFEGVAERPVFGWGQEGFNYVFNKFYDPSLYGQEAWFDRAHNAFIDWLSAGGVPAFLLYLSLFVSAFWLLWRRSGLSRAERIALTAALAGYACHNLFVFDNLYSYVYFFALLALIDSQAAKPLPRLESAPGLSADAGMTYALPIGAVVFVALVWTVNLPGFAAANELIAAITPAPDPSVQIGVFEDILRHPSFVAQEIREQLVSFAGAVAQDQQATLDQKQQAAMLAVTEMRKQVAAYPLDAREQLELAYAYSVAGDAPDALLAMDAAQALSPKKETILIQRGTLKWQTGDAAGAERDFDAAYALGPSFSDLAAYAAAGHVIANDRPGALAILAQRFGTTTVDNDVLALAYFRSKDWKDLIALWRLRLSGQDSAMNYFGLAASYAVSGDRADAMAVMRRAIVAHPEAAAQANAILEQLASTTAVFAP